MHICQRQDTEVVRTLHSSAGESASKPVMKARCCSLCNSSPAWEDEVGSPPSAQSLRYRMEPAGAEAALGYVSLLPVLKIATSVHATANKNVCAVGLSALLITASVLQITPLQKERMLTNGRLTLWARLFSCIPALGQWGCPKTPSSSSRLLWVLPSSLVCFT